MQQLVFREALDEAQAEAFSDALVEAGALSAYVEDADAGTSQEAARFAEPRMTAQDARLDQAPEDSVNAWRRNRVVALTGDDADVAALVAAASREAGMAVPGYVTAPVADEDWVRNSQAQFEPIHIGRRLWVVPSWHEPPATPEAIVLRIDPGRAFGTGSHPSTRLVLEWLESRLDARQDKEAGAGRSGPDMLDVLDYGCGSGILGIAAALLGARRVDAVDLDPQALDTARENAGANRVELRVGLPGSLTEGSYDIVVANILSQPLVILAPLLMQRVRRGGHIALSGILEAHAAEVMQAYAHDIALRVAARDDGWVLLEGERAP